MTIFKIALVANVAISIGPLIFAIYAARGAKECAVVAREAADAAREYAVAARKAADTCSAWADSFRIKA